MKPALWMILVLPVLWAGCAGTGNRPAGTAPSAARIRIGVLPFANNCRSDVAANLLRPLLLEGLTASGLTVIAGDSLRPVLRRNRIRSRGMIGDADARQLAAELDLDFLLTGSWDVYGAPPAPELGLSLRVLDPATGTLVRSISLGRTGEGRVGWLGMGRVDSLATLGTDLVDAALTGLLPLPEPGLPSAAGPRIAVVALDNLSESDNAGAVCSGILVTSLMKAGYDVLEPGFIRTRQLVRETAYRGAVDRENLLDLGRSYSLVAVATGTVDVLNQAVGDQITSVPRAALGLRVLDARTGRVFLARELAKAGNDHEGWFQQSRVHALTDLVSVMCDEFVKDLQNNLPLQEQERSP